MSDDVKFILGPWLVGTSLELVLMGVLATQFVNYFLWYPDDKISLRVAVVGLAVLNLLKSMLSFSDVWILLIENFGNLEANLASSVTAWWNTANPLMIALLNFYVQCYFCSRLWAISKRWYVVAPIFILFVFAIVSVVLVTYFIATANFPRVTNWFAAHMASVFAGDVVLTITTAIFLLKTKKNVLPQTVGLINALVRLTFQTAFPAALFAMFNLVFSQLGNGVGRIVFLGYVEIAFNQPTDSLPRIPTSLSYCSHPRLLSSSISAVLSYNSEANARWRMSAGMWKGFGGCTLLTSSSNFEVGDSEWSLPLRTTLSTTGRTTSHDPVCLMSRRSAHLLFVYSMPCDWPFMKASGYLIRKNAEVKACI
ncbi:hypothetical protein R3P38DRAFT_2579394 [Favolaschia claudopus]|uniref:Uncharacterized protein n=1 Tax=Favolaschia claudopus TaxID=2862362 RepID=A0AAV9ZET2_9AGAR